MQSSKILIVDHPRRASSLLEDGFFQTLDSSCTVVQCNSAIDALFSLNTEEDARLIFFDIDLPKMEGLSLLTRIPQEFPGVKLLVHGSVNTAIPASNITIIDRNQSPVETARIIIDAVESNSETIQYPPLAIPELLQVVEQEKQTTLMQITSNGYRGLCCFDKGLIVDALFKDKKGEDALLEIINWQDSVVTFKEVPKHKIKQRINRSLTQIILTATLSGRMTTDKANDGEMMPLLPEQKSGVASDGGTVSGKIPAETIEEIATGCENENAETGGSLSENNLIEQQNITKEIDIMSLEDHLGKLKKINGFKAAAIMNFTGEILVMDSVDPNIQLELVGATFNDIFRTAHEATEKIGLEACQETTIKTPQGLIIMRCSGVTAKVHFHMIMIMATDGNQALAKMEMEKLIPVVLEELV